MKQSAPKLAEADRKDAKGINWHSTLLWGIIGVLLNLILWFLTFLITPLVNKEWPTKFGEFLITHRLLVGLVGILITSVFWIVKVRRQNNDLRRSLTAAENSLSSTRQRLAAAEAKLATIESTMPTPKVEEIIRFRRFENIEKIVYGHIAYSPLLDHDEAGRPYGVGITLLEMIFGHNRIEALDIKALWSDFVDELASGQYDIVATPIFETRERSTKIAFCSPMFYSNIGLYVKKGHKVLGRSGENSWSFDEAIETLQRMSPKVVAIAGEISGKMALKYLGLTPEDKSKWLDPNRASVASLIKAVNGEGKMECEVVFAEVFQAEQTEAVRAKDVINILKPKALLYPVSFAVRKEDYVLRRYINLKLLQIEESLPDGVLKVIFDEMQKNEHYRHYTLEDIKRFFVRDYPAPGIKHDVGQTSTSPKEPPTDNKESRDVALQGFFKPDEVASSGTQIKSIGIDLNDAFAKA